MKLIHILGVNLFFFVIGCNNLNTKDKRIISDFDVKLLIKDNIYRINTIRKMNVWGIEYYDGKSILPSEDMDELINNLIDNKKYDTVISIKGTSKI